MNIRSLGYRSELIFHRFDAEVIDRGEYIFVRTPNNPSFFWGNFLLFPHPPALGDLDVWTGRFQAELGAIPGIAHLAFGWDGIDGEVGDIGPFIDRGYELADNVVLATAVPGDPPHYNRDVDIRPLTLDSEWETATVDKIEFRDLVYTLNGYTKYMRGQMSRYRQMADAGLGLWFGAFICDKMVASLGIFHDGNGLGRYQHVETHPDYRRQGICGTLVSAAGRYAREHMGLETLVMIADEHYHAARIYESVGFQPIEKIRGVTWWDRKR